MSLPLQAHPAAAPRLGRPSERVSETDSAGARGAGVGLTERAAWRVAALGELIPMIGPILSAIPAVAVAFTQSPAQGLLTLGFYVLVQQIENYVVVPRIMERAVNIHPLGVMLALLAGAELYGITGAILSLPVAAAVAVLLAEVRRARGQDEPRVGSGAPSEGRV